MSRKRIALGVGASVIERIAVSLTQIGLVPILATHWGLERYGGWSMLMTLPSLLVLGDLGFGGAAVVRMTMEVARGERAAARATVRSAAQVLAAACGVLFTVACCAAVFLPGSALPAIPGETGSELRLSIILLTAYTSVVLFSALLQGVFRSTGRFAQSVGIATFTYLLENALLITAILLGKGILGGVIALTLGRTIGYLVNLIAAARLRSGLLPALSGGSAQVRRELLRPALATMSIPLATALLLQGTVAGLGAVAGTLAVPAFVAARTLSRIGLQATQVLTGALMPEFGGASAREDHARVLKLFVLLSATATVIAVPFAAVLAIAGPWIVLVWSNHRIHAEPAMMLAIAVSALCGALWKPLSDLMLAQQRQTAFAPVYAALAIAGVAFTLLASPKLGSTAPALALALVDLAMLGLVGRFAWRNWASHGSIRATLRGLWHDGRSGLRQLLRRPG
jgi:O-antigen/teichoic acid export membrane protein